MQPSFHGAPAPKERRAAVFQSRSARPQAQDARSTQGARASEMAPLLEAAMRNARISECVADATHSALESQEEKIDSAAQHVRGIKDVAAEAGSFVKQLRARIFSKKLCLWLTVALLLGCIVGLFVHHFFYHR